MIYTGGKSIVSAYTNGISVKEIYANGVKVWPSEEPPVPQNNKIYYTSSDGQVVTPYNTSNTNWGANIVSNTYVNGQGIITFDSDIYTIAYQAFYYCTTLTSVTLPNSITTISERAFSNCERLVSINIPNGVTVIKNSAFSYTSLTSIVLPDSVTDIQYAVFDRCENLSSVTFGSGITTIGNRAFNECYRLTSIVLPDSVLSIGEWAFGNHRHIYHTDLTTLVIGNSVTSIGKDAFAYNGRLTSITINAIVPPVLGGNPDLGGGVFVGNDAPIRVPAVSVEAYKTASGWSYWADRIVSQ